MKYLGFFDKKSLQLSARNPLKKDETVIDYDMSSEEEWNEQNGEDLEAKQEDEDDEEDKQSDEEEEGFIVPDDYLSVSELDLSQTDNTQIQAQLEDRKQLRQNKTSAQSLNLQPFVLVFENRQGVDLDRKLVVYRQEYRAVRFRQDAHFPILLKHREGDREEEKTNKLNPNAINDKLKELVQAMHGSFESK